MARHNFLFSSSSLSGVLQGHQMKMEAQALALPPERVLGVSTEELVAELVTEFRIEPLVLDSDGVTADPEETRIDLGIGSSGQPISRPGLAITYFVPFTGEPELFKCQPSTFSSNWPTGIVRDAHVELRYEAADAKSEDVSAYLLRAMEQLKQWVGYSTLQVEEFNSALPGWAEGAVVTRTATVRANQELVAGLGVPLRRRPDAPTTYPAPEIRRKPNIRAARAASAPAAPPEPIMLSEVYQHILGVISNMAQTIELSPSAFAGMKEEDLRFQFLVPLNGQYEGSATGETFNFEGKTDILVKSKGRNVFIAECKFWSGPKGLTDAVDQLLGYTSWRDTKTAILLFNRKGALSTVLDKVAPTIAAHQRFVREVDYGDETSFRFVLRHKNDDDRHLTLTVLVFDIPIKK